MYKKYVPSLPTQESHDEFLVRACANVARGIGNPAPTQEEIQTAQNWLINKLQGLTVRNFTGPRYLVGYDDVELIYIQLVNGQSLTGNYLYYK